MPNIHRTARGDLVDVDLIKIKQQITTANVDVKQTSHVVDITGEVASPPQGILPSSVPMIQDPASGSNKQLPPDDSASL